MGAAVWQLGGLAWAVGSRASARYRTQRAEIIDVMMEEGLMEDGGRGRCSNWSSRRIGARLALTVRDFFSVSVSQIQLGLDI